MPVLWLILLIAAVAATRLARQTSDDLALVIAGAAAVFFFIGGLVTAPLPIKIIILAGALLWERFVLGALPRSRHPFRS